MSEIINQLNKLRPAPVSQQLTARVLSQANSILTGQRHTLPRPRERVFTVLVAAMSLAHAIWTVAFMNDLVR